MVLMGIVTGVFGQNIALIVLGKEPVVLGGNFIDKSFVGGTRMVGIKRFREEPVEILAIIGDAEKDGLTDFLPGVFVEHEAGPGRGLEKVSP